MMSVFDYYRVKHVYTQTGHTDGREDELHMDIVGLGRVIVPKSELRRIADALLDANTIGRLRSSGKQPAPEEPGPNRERADELFLELMLGLHPDHGLKLIELVGLYQKQDPPPVFTPADQARADERMAARLYASELLTKLQASCPDHKEDLIELVVLCRGQGIL